MDSLQNRFDVFQYLQQEQNIKLTTQQKQAISRIHGPVLLLAVPGAGKTTVMVARIANMIFGEGISPKKLLTITFSKASAGDMAARYQKLFGQLHLEKELPFPAFSTIHAFCYRVIRNYGENRQTKVFDIITPRQKSDILRLLYHKINGEFLTEDVEEEMTSCFSYIQNRMLRKERLNELESSLANLWELYEGYRDAKRENGVMDFDDMLTYARTAFRKYPSLLEYYRRRYPYICVDEAQDTSLLQHDIIRLLSAPQHNLFLVGDEDQSIYRFRGASPETLLNFEHDFPGAQVLKMEENFRSVKQIVERTNLFIAENKERYPKNMFTNNGTGKGIEVPKLSDLSEQYRCVVQAALEESGTVAAIFRNNFSAVPLADVLERNGIDFYIKDQKSKVTGNYVVKDIQAFFALSYDANDFESFQRIFYKTGSYLRRGLLKKMNTNPLHQGETWFDRILDVVDDNVNTGKVRFTAALIEKLKAMNPSKALDTIYQSLGYQGFVEFLSGGSYSIQANKMSALKNLASRTADVESFLKRVAEMDQIMEEHSQRKDSRITLTTAHSAKGLEFDTVVILDATEYIFPAHSAIESLREGSIKEMEEEARLFYVACTRARNHLIIPTATVSEQAQVLPSRFIPRLIKDKEPIPVKTAQEENLNLHTGMYLEHNTFGEGQVMSVNRERGTFQVFFRKFGSRTLSIDIVSKQGIITKVE